MELESFPYRLGHLNARLRNESSSSRDSVIKKNTTQMAMCYCTAKP